MTFGTRFILHRCPVNSSGRFTHVCVLSYYSASLEFQVTILKKMLAFVTRMFVQPGAPLQRHLVWTVRLILFVLL